MPETTETTEVSPRERLLWDHDGRCVYVLDGRTVRVPEFDAPQPPRDWAPDWTRT